MNASTKPSFYLLFKLVGSCLASTLFFTPFPELRKWLCLSIAVLLVLLLILKRPLTKVVVGGSAIALALYSFAIGNEYFNGRGLDNPGLLLLLSAFPIVIFVAVFVASREAK